MAPPKGHRGSPIAGAIGNLPGFQEGTRARGFRKTPLHWKRTMDEMLDALLDADVIALLPKPDTKGAPRIPKTRYLRE